MSPEPDRMIVYGLIVAPDFGGDRMPRLIPDEPLRPFGRLACRDTERKSLFLQEICHRIHNAIVLAAGQLVTAFIVHS